MPMAIHLRRFCAFMASQRWFNPVSVYKIGVNGNPLFLGRFLFGARARGGSMMGDLGFARRNCKELCKASYVLARGVTR
jgi:hypothetical protein